MLLNEKRKISVQLSSESIYQKIYFSCKEYLYFTCIFEM